MTGRRILLAGATGALGRDIAAHLAEAGHRVAVHTHRRADDAHAIVRALPGAGHVAAAADLADQNQTDAMVAGVREAWGELDHVVNAAWPAVGAVRVGESDDGAIEAGLLGYRAHAHLCRAVLPSLRRTRGSIVFLGGALATRLHPGLGHFGAGKAAAALLTHVLALEEGGHGVRANVLSLGRIDVDLDRDLAESDPVFEALDRIGELRRALPLPTARDVASAIGWLIADDAGALTGQTISIAGGERV